LQQTIQEARYDWGAAWESSFDAAVFPALRKMRDLCLKDGTTLAAIIFPVSLQVYAEFDDPYIRLPQDKLLEFGKRESIPFLDLLPHLRKHRNESLTPDQGHLNENGNRVAASYMYPFLKQVLKNHLKKGINKRRYGGALDKDDKRAKEQQKQDHRRQPPPLVLPEEKKKLAHNAYSGR